MATIRRLSDADVRAIFESLHGNLPPPPHLKFKIVPVGPNGLKLSPPSYEFEDGLYVLLKPEKKRKSFSSYHPDRKLPSNLQSLLMPDIPAETCPWSLSGPQFPKPTAIQQRYCYPKGNPDYSSRKGGALWTMYGRDGKEDLEFRLLHVYFSAKRAVNKGIYIPDSEVQEATEASNYTIGTPASKRKKTRGRGHHHVTSPMSMTSATTLASVDSSTTSRTNCASPLSFDMFHLPPPSPHQEITTSRRSSSIFVSPHTEAGSHDRDMLMSGFHPVSSSFDHTKVASPFRPQRLVPITNVLFDERDDEHEHGLAHHDEPFPCDLESFHADLDTYWNDPLFALVMKPSMDNGDDRGGLDPQALKSRLNKLHERIRDGILNSPQGDQGPLLSVLSTWARCIAKAPLSDLPREVDSEMTAV